MSIPLMGKPIQLSPKLQSELNKLKQKNQPKTVMGIIPKTPAVAVPVSLFSAGPMKKVAVAPQPKPRKSKTMH